MSESTPTTSTLTTVAPSEAPILMVLWSDHELDEIAEAKRLLSEKFGSDRIPDIADRIVYGHDPDDFLGAIDELLTAHSFAQGMYISAHGTKDGLHLHANAVDPMVTFEQIAAVFRKHEHNQSRLRLAMGACKAGSAVVPLRDLLPKYVTRYTAFSGSPTAGNVSEMIASIVMNKIDLMQDVQKAIDTGRATWTPGMKPSKVLEQLVTPALDAYTDDPGRLVSGSKGGFLFDYVRDRDGKWHEVYASGEAAPK